MEQFKRKVERYFTLISKQWYNSRGHRLHFFTKNAVFSLKINFAVANSVDPDEMLHYVTFYLGLLCLHL